VESTRRGRSSRDRRLSSSLGSGFGTSLTEVVVHGDRLDDTGDRGLAQRRHPRGNHGPNFVLFLSVIPVTTDYRLYSLLTNLLLRDCIGVVGETNALLTDAYRARQSTRPGVECIEFRVIVDGGLCCRHEFGKLADVDADRVPWLIPLTQVRLYIVAMPV
jgi:hypothetical protein